MGQEYMNLFNGQKKTVNKDEEIDENNYMPSGIL